MMLTPKTVFRLPAHCVRILAVGISILACARGFAQDPGGATAITGPGTFKIVNGQIMRIQANPDPFDTMITSAASFDMDSPVEAQAEFDPPVASVGQRVVYRVVVTALDESLKMPDQLPAPDGLDVQKGGRAQVYEPTGARKLKPKTTVLYHLVASTNGTFTMPSFDVTAYGKPVKVPTTNLVVVPVGAPGAGQGPPVMTAEIPESDIYVGQMVRIPLVLPDTDGSVHNLTQSSISGEFIVPEPYPVGMRQENVRSGDKTVPAFVQEIAITPLREGSQRLIAQGHTMVIEPIPGSTNGAMRVITKLIDSDPFTIKVKPLPTEGKLPGFAGAVGEFQVEPPKLSTNEVRAGEPVTLTVAFHGDINLSHLKPPAPPSVPDWQTFPPVDDAAGSPIVLRSSIASFSYTMIPLNAQIKATPPIPFSYFDPKKKEYVDLTIPSVPLTVKPSGMEAEAQATAGNAGPGDKAAVQEKEPVLAGLVDRPGTAMNLAPLQRRWWFLTMQLLPALTLSGLWAWERRRRHLEQHPEIILKRRARRGLRRELRRTRRAAATKDAPEFVSGAVNALREACAPHGAANPEALVCADVLRELPATDQQAGEMVRRLFTASDAMQFGNAEKNGAHLLSLQPDLERLLEHLKTRL